MNLFAELRKKRGPLGLVADEENLLYNKIIFLYMIQLNEEEKGKKDENNDLFSNNIDKNLDNINKENDEEIDVLKLLQNIKLPDDKVKKISTSIKKNEDNLIISENIKIKDVNINIPFNNSIKK